MLLSFALFAFAAAIPVPPASESPVLPTPPAQAFPAGLSPPALRRQTKISNRGNFEKELVRSTGFPDAIAQEAGPSAWELFIKATDKELDASGKKLADQLKKTLASARNDGQSSDVDWKESIATRNLKTFPMMKKPTHRREAPLTRDEWRQVAVEMQKAEELQEHRAQITSDKLKWEALKSQFTPNLANPLGAEAAQTVSKSGTVSSGSASVATTEETSNLFVRLGIAFQQQKLSLHKMVEVAVKPVEKTPEEIEIEENDLKTPAIVTKYQIAGDLANKALLAVLKEIKNGANIKELCALGDSTIATLAKTVYNKGNIKKGIAFPTTISPRNYVCNLSPLEGDAEAKITLENGDLVRIELGVHVDGYIAQAGKTVVVGEKIEGKKADVVKAVHLCADAALRLVKPGENNVKFTETIGAIAKEFGLVPVEGMLTSQIMRNVLDGPNQVHQNPPEDIKKSVSPVTFEVGQVYTISLLLSTSTEGKTKTASDARTTIYKRNPDATYQLKMKTSRLIYSQVQKEFGSMAFQLGALEDVKKARMGIIECTTHGLVTPYQVLQEKQDDAELASIVITVLLMPNGPLTLSPAVLELDAAKYVSDKSLASEEIKALLETPVRVSKKKK